MSCAGFECPGPNKVLSLTPNFAGQSRVFCASAMDPNVRYQGYQAIPISDQQHERFEGSSHVGSPHHTASSMGGAEPGPGRKHAHASVFEARGAGVPTQQPGRAVYRPKKSRYWYLHMRSGIPFSPTEHMDSHRIMRWLVLHASGEKQTKSLEKRQLIQV